MKHVFKTLAGTLAVMGMLVGASVGMGTQPVHAADCTDAVNCVKSGVDKAGGTNNSTDLMTFITNIINVILFVAGAVAVIMIIIGGIRYITSNGDQTHVKAAKDTILYSVVGLIVALLAYAIVNFVVTKL